MKIKEGFELKEIADRFVAIPTHENVVDFSSVIMLNETSAFMWNLLEETDMTEDELTQKLLSEYDVDEKTAVSDVSDFIAELKKAEVLEG